MTDKKILPWWRTLTGEEELKKINDSFKKEQISYGAVSRELEERFSQILDVPYVMACTSGSTALYIGLKALGIGPGDEVLVQDRTFHATAHAALLAGATVRLVEVDHDLPVMNLENLKKKISKNTKAIMPVHLNGRAGHIHEIVKIASERGIHVVEDTAQALYSRTSQGFLGTLGDVGCFSLGMTKLISTGQGGFVTTHNKETFEKFKHFISHGVESTFDGTFNNFGFNFRMTDILASMGHIQLDRLEQKVKHLNELNDLYANAFENLNFLNLIPVKTPSEVPLWVEVFVEERERLRTFLYDNGIESRKFLPSLHKSAHLNTCGDDDFKNSWNFDQHGLFLPCGPDMSFENVKKVIQVLKSF